jgi:hypothetical protein
MQAHFQRFWSLYAVVICYAGSVLKMMFGGTNGTTFQPEDATQGGLAALSLTFTAIFLVGLHSCMSSQWKGSQEHERE